MSLKSYLPILSWLRSYRPADFPKDLSAGLIVAVMLIPQGMAYAMLAGLPPVVGLYASTLPLIIYAFFGTSRQLAVGPVAIVSLLTLSGVSVIAEQETEQFVLLAALLALMVGVVQLGLGLLRAGFVTNFLSHAVISGFTSAAALVIGLSQLKHLLGLSLPRTESVFALLWEAGSRLPEVNLITLLIGVSSIALLVVLKRVMPRFPAPLLVVGLSTLAVYFFGLHERGVKIVGTVPSGLPSFTLPGFEMSSLVALIPVALTISFVSFMESIAVAKSIAAKEGYKVDSSQELVALGVSNLASAVVSGYPVTGGFSRSAVNFQAGARTPLASVITAVIIVLTLLFFTPLFYYLPNAVLAAIIMVAVYGLIDVQELRHLFKLKAIDGWTLVLTFLATLVLGIEEGILIGAGFSLLVFIWRSAHPHTAQLGYLASEDVFRNVRRYPEVELFDHTYIVRVDASLYFANMAFLENRLDELVNERDDLRYIVVDASSVNDIDAVALDTLRSLMENLRARGIDLHVAGLKGPVRDVFARADWVEDFPGRFEHLSVQHALESLNVWPHDRLELHPAKVGA